MAEDDAAEKSFDATPHKLEQARKKGEIPKSTDLTAAVSYLGLLLAVLVFGPDSIESMVSFMAGLIERSDRVAAVSFEDHRSNLAGVIIGKVMGVIFIILGIPAAIVLIVLTVQRSWVFAPEKLGFKLSRISPISGVKNKFGANGLFEFAKSTFKLGIVCSLLVWFSINHFDLILESAAMSFRQILMSLNNLIAEFILLILVMSLIVGGADYLWQVASHLKKNRMTRKEIDDESKSNEGDPHHKQTRRQRGYEIAMNQMLSEVPSSDVILVNPTHYAVALKWSRSSQGAPICVAKGTDEIAARIKEIALASAIPIHSDPPTTRAVFATTELGAQISPEHYMAVAVAIRFAEAMRQKAEMQ